jgi:hypothetical protein
MAYHWRNFLEVIPRICFDKTEKSNNSILVSRLYLAQILERINRIKDFTSDGKQAFFADLRTQDAVIRNFEIIGEAAKRIPKE